MVKSLQDKSLFCTETQHLPCYSVQVEDRWCVTMPKLHLAASGTKPGDFREFGILRSTLMSKICHKNRYLTTKTSEKLDKLDRGLSEEDLRSAFHDISAEVTCDDRVTTQR